MKFSLFQVTKIKFTVVGRFLFVIAKVVALGSTNLFKIRYLLSDWGWQGRAQTSGIEAKWIETDEVPKPAVLILQNHSLKIDGQATGRGFKPSPIDQSLSVYNGNSIFK